MSLRTAALLALVLAPIMSMALNSTNDENGHFHEHKENEDHERNELGLWLASTAAIIIISLCGIFGVLVIPIMQKVFYQHLIQFLVALAIGKLLKLAYFLIRTPNQLLVAKILLCIKLISNLVKSTNFHYSK